MESLNGATSRTPAVGQSKEWVERTNMALQLLGVFLLINGIYFALFEADIYTALVFYSFVLMVLTGVGYCYYFTAEDVEYVLRSCQYTGSSMIDSIDLLNGRSTPNQQSTSERRRL
ncbi:hypothetical protein [Halocatena salina]|uniref:Uncharacterized protein n=1 Tax=Halocatena salina TaxID=2934340 RepID=A0A8U0A5G3_9EURY|nr:hypothetical protein [Halocatena salina]UPM43193.1 hypothetical protein MW046_01795 [Halocatena salina]